MTRHVQFLITGSFSVGKTTLARAMAQRSGYGLLEEPIRELEPLGYSAEAFMTQEMRSYLTYRQVLVEALARHKAPTIIDAGLPAVLAYNQLARGEAPKIEHLQIEAMKYTAIALLPPEHTEITPDGFRFHDLELQNDIHARLVSILDSHRLVYTTLLGGLNDRLERASELLSSSEDGP